MAAILKRAAALAAQHLHHWEILDYASADKPDVPSGTSRELAETLAEVRTPQSVVPLSGLDGLVEARGAEVAGPNPLAPAAQLRGDNRDYLRWRRGAAGDAP